jgi:hypothetical protein
MEALADQIAYALNIMIDLEQYLPILLNPSRCLDEDLPRVLALHGIDVKKEPLSVAKQRRLAILAQLLSVWRGSFASHRATSNALAGGVSIIRPYLVNRVVVDESSMSFVLIPDVLSNNTDIFLLGQGPSATEFEEGETLRMLQAVAIPLDQVTLIPCWALTAWKDGYGSWLYTDFDPSMVATTVNGEYEAMDLGPDIDAVNAEQYIRTPTVKDTIAGFETQWITVWFKIDGTALNEYWEVYAYASSDGPDGGSSEAYVARINNRSGNLTLHRKYAGTVGSAIATIPFVIGEDLAGDYHRFDFFIIQAEQEALLRVAVDGNPSFWYADSVIFIGNRPRGSYGFAGLDTAVFTQGTLRLGALTFRDQYVGNTIDITFVAPDAVSGLYVWWDGYDSANYNGSSELLSITDKSANTIDATPDSTTGPTPVSYEVNGVPTDLPGNFTVALPTNHPESAAGLAKVLTDFTVFAIVPTENSQTTGSAMFSIYGDDGGGANFQFVFGQGTTPGHIQAFMQGGSFEIDVDFNNGNTGSHAIVIFRREAGVDLTMDCWYDSLDGGGIQKPTQESYGSDPTTGTLTIDSMAYGGRGSITQVWSSNPIHTVAVYDRALTDSEVLLLALWAGNRLGISGIS